MRLALAALPALLLCGCAAAAVPMVAGGAILASDRDKPPMNRTGPQPAAADIPAPAAPLPDDFAAFVTHVEQREMLRREGAPINSLVLDSRQTVLNPVALGCARREPLVMIDADPAPGSAADASAQAAWGQSLARIRAADVGIMWVTERFENEVAELRASLTGAEPADVIAGRNAPDDRKQAIRQRWAATHCILAVVGDTRADADEAYGFLRDPATPLPIDSNWGAGWFLLPVPLLTP